MPNDHLCAVRPTLSGRRTCTADRAPEGSSAAAFGGSWTTRLERSEKIAARVPLAVWATKHIFIEVKQRLLSRWSRLHRNLVTSRDCRGYWLRSPCSAIEPYGKYRR